MKKFTGYQVVCLARGSSNASVKFLVGSAWFDLYEDYTGTRAQQETPWEALKCLLNRRRVRALPDCQALLLFLHLSCLLEDLIANQLRSQLGKKFSMD